MSECHSLSEPAPLSDMAEAFLRVADRDAAFDVLVSFVRDQGFSDVMLTVENSALSPQRRGMRWSTLNEDRLAMIEVLGFDGHDPIRRFARRSLDPFVWTVENWPGLNSTAGRKIMNGLARAEIEAGVTAAIWGRTGRMAVIDAFGAARRVQCLTPWDKESFLMAAAMTFRAIERLSLVRDGVGLTRREVEILDLVSQGMTVRAIARQLAIVEATVKFHLKSARGKLKARNTSEAVARFAMLDLSSIVSAQEKENNSSAFHIAPP